MTQSLINYPSDTNQLVKQAAPSNQLNLSAQALNASFQALANLITALQADVVALQADIGNYLLLAGGTMSGDIDMDGNNITNGGEISGFVNSGDGTFAYDLGNASLKYAAKFTQNDGAIVQIPTDDYSLYAVAGTGQFAAGFFMDSSNRYQATFGSDETSGAGGFTDGENNVYIADGNQAIAASGNGYTANLADNYNGAAGLFQDSSGNAAYIANNNSAVQTNGSGYHANLSDGDNYAAGFFQDESGNYVYIANGTNAITAMGAIVGTNFSIDGTNRWGINGPYASGASTATGYIPILLNGTTYYLLAHT